MAGKRQDNDGRQDIGLDQFERQLMAISPNAAQLDRATALFRAGQESVRSSEGRLRVAARCWSAATAMLGLLTLGLSWHIYQDARMPLVDSSHTVRSPRHEPSDAASGPDDLAGSSRSSPSHVTADSESRGADQNEVMPRNNYLNQRRLAMTVGLEAMVSPRSLGSSGVSNTSSYRDLKDSVFGADRSGPHPHDNSESTRTNDAQGDRT